MKPLKKTFYTSVITILICTLIASALAQVSQRKSGRYFSGLFNAEVACNFDEETSETTFNLTTSKGKVYNVVFQDGITPPDPGTWATLQGFKKGDTLYANNTVSYMPAGDNSHRATGEQKIVIALVNFQDALTENVTTSQVEDRMFDPNYSAEQWWIENSYGKTWASGDVFGWLTLPMDRACEPSQIRNHTIAALDPLTDLTQYDRLYILIPGAGGCSWGGLGSLGFSTYSTDDGPWSTTTSWTRSEYFNENTYNPSAAVFVTAHEFGHNFGQHHSSSIVWSGESLGDFDCEGCGGSVSNYGDAFSSLGGSWRTGHFNPIVKRNLDWFEPENELDVTRSGIYEIDAYEVPSNVPKTLKILRGFAPTSGRNEYIDVEWRQPIGYDTHINWFSGAVYNGVVLHFEWQVSNRSYKPDMTPGDDELKNAGLPTGTLWSDNYTHLSVKPLGVVGNKMQVEVQIGTPVFADSFNLVRGTLVSGIQTDFNESDDQRVTLKAGATLTPTEPPIWIEFEGTHTGTLPEALRFELESSSLSSLNQTVEMFNFTTGTWDTNSQTQTSSSDGFIEANVWSNASVYVQPGTGTMLTRVQYKTSGPVLSWPWNVTIDQAVWKILR